jgi:hypothetical protein
LTPTEKKRKIDKGGTMTMESEEYGELTAMLINGRVSNETALRMLKHAFLQKGMTSLPGLMDIVRDVRPYLAYTFGAMIDDLRGKEVKEIVDEDGTVLKKY